MDSPLLWHVLLLVSFVDATNFLQVPADVNSTLGSQVQFFCRISSIIQDFCDLTWRISGGEEGLYIDTPGYSSTLTLDASVANNGTQIECACEDGSNVDYTDPVVLRVQGLLEPPTGLRTESTTNTIQLFWNPPFSLELPGQAEITGYIVTVENVNTASLRNYTSSVPVFILMREDFVHCDTFRMKVLGLNILGEGKQSEYISTTYIGPTIHTALMNISLDFGESTVVNCSAPCNTAIVWFVNGQQVQGTNTQQCNSEGFQTEGAEVFTEVNETAVQCAAVSICSEDLNCATLTCYSRIAYITVFGQAVEQPTTQFVAEHQITTEPSNPVTNQILTTTSAMTGLEDVKTYSNISQTTNSEEPTILPTEKDTILIISVGAAVGGCFLILCVVLLLVLVIVIAAKYYGRQKTGNTSSKDTQDDNPVEDTIYESSSEVQNYLRRASNNEQPGPYYSLPLPTDSCAAYGAMKRTLEST